jgi:hypothetical protein
MTTATIQITRSDADPDRPWYRGAILLDGVHAASLVPCGNLAGIRQLAERLVESVGSAKIEYQVEAKK